MGWTWEYIDMNMTLPRLYAMNDYWAQHPPAHILVAAYMGYDSKKAQKADLGELMAGLEAAGIEALSGRGSEK